jgi:hypothetical protein
LLTLLLAALVALGGMVACADEPPPAPGDAPLRLKKKPKPADDKADPAKAAEKKPAEKKPDEKKPDEKKPEDKKDEAKEGPAPTAPEPDEKEVMERLARNVRSVADRLKEGELNEGTRQLQEDILKDIESLIRRSENPQGGAGGGQQQDQNQDQDQNNSKAGKQGQGKQGDGKDKQGNSQAKGGPGGPGDPGQGQNGKQGRGKGRQRGKMARANNQRGGHLAGGGQPQGGKEGQGTDPAGSGENRGGLDGNDKARGELNRNADLDKQDVWGHLPESMRASMNAYAGRQEFMAKHEALIKKYYSTIATEGRRKGDRP